MSSGTEHAADAAHAVAEHPMSGMSVVRHLRASIAAAEDVMASARRLRHKPEHAKLLIAASEHLRRLMETAIRLSETVWNLQQVDRFHARIIEAVRLHSPACADQILADLETVAHCWASDATALPNA